MRPKHWITQIALQLILVTHAHSQENLQDVRARSRLYEPLIASIASRYDVDARLLWTIAYLESRFRPEAVSYKDGLPCAFGMMQFLEPTARRYGLRNPHDVREAVDAAARYVRELEKRFEGRRELVLAAYNAGEGTVEAFRDGRTLVLPNGKVINPARIRTGGIPPYKETRDYVARGNSVYQGITQAGLFLTRAQAKEAVDLETNSKVGSQEQSIYILESHPKSETDERDEKAKSSRSRGPSAAPQSIYVN
jgi:membrane-bound lytic murein transglycosylase MltF